MSVNKTVILSGLAFIACGFSEPASAQLSIKKTLNDGPSCVQNRLCKFRITVTNVGSATYSGDVDITDVVSNPPAGVNLLYSYESVNSHNWNWSCTQSAPNQPIKCEENNLTLQPGVSAYFDITLDLHGRTNCATLDTPLQSPKPQSCITVGNIGGGGGGGGTVTPPPPGPDVNFLSGRGTAWSARNAEGYVGPGNFNSNPQWILMGSAAGTNVYDGEIAATERRYVLCVKPGNPPPSLSFNAVYDQSQWRPRFYSGWSGAAFAVSANKLLVQNATKTAMHNECQQLGAGFTVANFHQSRDNAGNRGGWNAGGTISATGPNQHLLRDATKWLRNTGPSDTSQFLIYIKDQN